MGVGCRPVQQRHFSHFPETMSVHDALRMADLNTMADVVGMHTEARKANLPDWKI